WVIGRVNLGDSDEEALTEFRHLDADQDMVERYERENVRDLGRCGYSGALGFRRVLEPQRNEFSSELRYSINGSDADTADLRYVIYLAGGRVDVPPALTRVGTSTHDRLLAFQADLMQPITE